MAGGYMGLAAAGAYLKALRDTKGYSLNDAAKALETSKSQIERIEEGGIDTRVTLFLGYARYVDADINNLVNIVFNDTMTPEQAATVATQNYQAINEISETYTHDHLVERLKVISAQLDDEEDAAFIQAILSLIDGWWLRIQRLRLLPLRRRKTT